MQSASRCLLLSSGTMGLWSVSIVIYVSHDWRNILKQAAGRAFISACEYHVSVTLMHIQLGTNIIDDFRISTLLGSDLKSPENGAALTSDYL